MTFGHIWQPVDWPFPALIKGIFIIRPSKTGCMMSCHPSVCPSIKFSCPLHNSDTVQDIFIRLSSGPKIPKKSYFFRPPLNS